jgi:dTDP-4-amino-4,6-dideoxygalactose transaminase
MGRLGFRGFTAWWGQLDPADVAADHAKTKAIIPVHLYGEAAPMEEVMELARGMVFGSWKTWRRRRSGSARAAARSWRYGCFSFYPTKNLAPAGCGPGDDEQRRDRCIRLLEAAGGRAGPGRAEVHHPAVGYNSRWTRCRRRFCG